MITFIVCATQADFERVRSERGLDPKTTRLLNCREHLLGFRDYDVIYPAGGTWTQLPPEILRAIQAEWASDISEAPFRSEMKRLREALAAEEKK